MTVFCIRLFLEPSHDIWKCSQCRKAWAEIQAEEQALSSVEGPLTERSEEERAALDSKGRP